MCWNAPVSWLTFLIGTGLNIWLLSQYQHTTIISLAIFWEWILLMQIFEGIYWTNADSNSNMADFATKGANLNSILQPVILILLLLASSSVSYPNKIVVCFVAIFYLGYLFTRFFQGENVPSTLQPLEGCSHLNLSWWQTLRGSGVIYALTLLLALLLLLRPYPFMWIILGYITVALVSSIFIYPCGLASMWCWFAALGPLVTYFAWKYTGDQ